MILRFSQGIFVTLICLNPTEGHAGLWASCKTKIVMAIVESQLRGYRETLSRVYGKTLIDQTYSASFENAVAYRALLWENRATDPRMGFRTPSGFARIGDGLQIPGQEGLVRVSKITPQISVEVQVISPTGFLRSRVLTTDEALVAVPAPAEEFDRLQTAALDAHERKIEASEREARERHRTSDPSTGQWIVGGKETNGSKPMPRAARKERKNGDTADSEPAPKRNGGSDSDTNRPLSDVDNTADVVPDRVYSLGGISLKGVKFSSSVMQEFTTDPFLESTFPRFVQKLQTAAVGKVAGVFERLDGAPAGVYSLRIMGRSRGEYRLLGCFEGGIFIVLAIADHKSLNPIASRISCK